MKVVLINPRTDKADTFELFSFSAPPMGLAYIAAVLERENYTVKIIDAQALHLSPSMLEAQLRREEPDIVGITATTTTLSEGMNAAKVSKESCPDAFTILGGPHATFLPTETLTEYPQLDAVCIGEGEETMLELTRTLERNGDLARVKGIAYRTDKGTRKTPPRQLISDLNSLPFPARNLLPLEEYKSLGKPHRVASVLSSRGCPFNCAFCSCPNIFDRKFRARSAQNVVDEIQHIIEEYNIRAIEFIDDIFTLDSKRIEDICREIKRRGLDVVWSCCSRTDTVSERLLTEMAETGCRGIFYGIESGCQRVLDLMNKRESLQQMMRTVRWTKEAGIETWGFFILGFPGETREEIETTIRFAGEIGVDFAEFFITSAFPGSPVYEMAKKENRLLTTNWSDVAIGIPNIKNREISSQELNSYLIKAYKDFYNSPKVVSYFAQRGMNLLNEIMLRISQKENLLLKNGLGILN